MFGGNFREYPKTIDHIKGKKWHKIPFMPGYFIVLGNDGAPRYKIEDENVCEFDGAPEWKVCGQWFRQRADGAFDPI